MDKALAMQCMDLTSNSQNSHKASVAVSICDPMAPGGEEMEIRRSPKAHGPVNLADTVRNSNEIQSQKVAGKETNSQGCPLTSTHAHYLSYFSTAVMKHRDQKKAWGVKGLLGFHILNHSPPEKARQEPGGRS